MARKRKTSQGIVKTIGAQCRAAMAFVFRRRLVYALLAVFGMGAAVFAAGRGAEVLRTRVEQTLMDRRPFPLVDFSDLPPQLSVLAQAELEDSLLSLLDGPWTDDRLCRKMTERLEAVGWVSAVRKVKRYNDGRFVIQCDYRVPVALVQYGQEHFLVDDEHHRLPGLYRADSTWQVIEGIATKPPVPGTPWNSADLRAALQLLKGLRSEPFAHQIAAIEIGNFKGRKNAAAAHVVLRTQHNDGRIRWGSAPGTEIEENTLRQKLAILRENYISTGRADAGHAVIDVSTLPTRYSIPK